MLFMWFGCVCLSAQTEYNFSVLEGVYEPLTEGDTISRNLPWAEEDFYFELPYDVSIMGLSSNKFRAMQGAIRMDSVINGMPMNVVASAFATDLRSKASQPSASPIILQTNGAPGERITTLEFRNAHFELLDGVTDFVNFQIKYFEKDRSIEYHYGESKTDVIEEVSNNQSIIFGGLVGIALGDSMDLVDGYLLNGFADNPMVVRRYEVLQGFPQADNIFRFTPKTTLTQDAVNGHCSKHNEWHQTGMLDLRESGESIYVYSISGGLLFEGHHLRRSDLQKMAPQSSVLFIKSEACDQVIKHINR